MQILDKCILAATLFAVAGLIAGREVELPGLVGLSLLLFVAAACGLAVEIILKRELRVSKGDSFAYGCIRGLQAVCSGLSLLLLSLSLLVPGLAWAAGLGGECIALLKANPGLPTLAAGLWLFLRGFGVIAGKALCSVGTGAHGRVDTAIHLFNIALEKTIHLILCLVGVGLVVLGAASLLSGRGPLKLLLEQL